MSKDLSVLPIPPSTLRSLLRAGYETIDDVNATTPESLAKDLNIPLSLTQSIFSSTQKAAMPPLTQSAASILGRSVMKYSTLCKPVDALLEGGLKPGFVLEISGPPGTRKEALAVNLTRTFVEANKGVIFVDLQNMTSPEALKESLQRSTSLPPHHEQLVQYLNIHTLADFAIFLNQFQSVLDANPKVWGKLQSFLMELSLVPRLDFRNILLERIKQVLTKACASSRISVAITTQLATKFRNSDGTPATSDTGSRAVMVPQPDCVYLPNGKSYRIILVPQTRTSGTVRLLTWPTHVQGRNQQPLPEEPYEMVSGPKPSTLVSYIGVPS